VKNRLEVTGSRIVIGRHSGWRWRRQLSFTIKQEEETCARTKSSQQNYSKREQTTKKRLKTDNKVNGNTRSTILQQLQYSSKLTRKRNETKIATFAAVKEERQTVVKGAHYV